MAPSYGTALKVYSLQCLSMSRRRSFATRASLPITTSSRSPLPRLPPQSPQASSSWSSRAAATIRCCAVRSRCSRFCATNGRVEGLTLLSKRVGVTTRMLLDAVEGDVVSCLGPLGKPFEPVDPPAEAWMVAGGVGLAPFATLTEALRERGTPTTLFYGARSGTRAVLPRLVRIARRAAGAHHRRRQHRRARPRDGAARARAAARSRAASRSTPAGRSRCSKPSRMSRRSTGGGRRCRSSV